MILTPEDVSTYGFMKVIADGKELSSVVKFDSDIKEIHLLTSELTNDPTVLKPESAQLIKISDGSIIDSWSKQNVRY